MKRLIDFLKDQNARGQEQREARKARLKAMSHTRKLIYSGAWGLCISILLAGILTKTIHTAFLASLMFSIVAFPLITRPPRMLRKIIIGLVFSPPVMICLALALGGATTNSSNYDAATRDQATVRAASEEVARDAEKFLQDYKLGKLEEQWLLESPGHYAIELGRNDEIGYRMAKWAFGLIHLTAPADIDTTAILPFADMLYADKTVVLYDKDLGKKRAQMLNEALEARYGRPVDEISAAIKAKEAPDYKGIFILACTVKNDGEVLLATGLPSGFMTDLRKLPEAEPFLEVCRSVARSDTQDMTRVNL